LVALPVGFGGSYLFLAMPIFASAYSDAIKSEPWLEFRKVSAFVIRLIDGYRCIVGVSQTEEQVHAMQNESL